MALGGGTFISQNKVLPGSYINFISLSTASASLSDRGVAAMAMELDWGKDDEVFEVTSGDFQKKAQQIFGYDYMHDKLKGIRDLFKNARTLYAYKLNSNGTKASNDYAQALYGGIRGNDLKVIIQTNADDTTKKDVRLYLGSALVDSQTVTTATDLVDNEYVTWKKDADLDLSAGTPLTGGSNGSGVVTANYQSFLDKVEAYSFNAIGVVSETAAVNELLSAFCKRMRDELGKKFQAVCYQTAADYEGVVNTATPVTDDGWSKASLVYWVTGIIAGCEINASNLNKIYDGEFTVVSNLTQSQLEDALEAGQFLLHKVGADYRVLSDINSLITTSDNKGDMFKDNQTIRVIDQIANDIATLFNTKYLGAVPNDEAGRISLWADIVKHHEQLQDIRAIEDFTDSDVEVEAGDTKKSVVVSDRITVVNTMAQLYMTCVVA